MSEEFNSLNKSEKKIAAVKSLLAERVEIERELDVETFQLQLKYQQRFNEITKKIDGVLKSSEDIKAEACEGLLKIKPESIGLVEFVGAIEDEPQFGDCLKIYWFEVMKNFPEISTLIQEHDQDILNHLVDIRSYIISPQNVLPQYPELTKEGLIVEFEFEENPFFSNKVLYKYFRLEVSSESEHPLVYVGYTPTSSECSKIDWKPNQDVTVTTIVKNQRNKKTKQVRTITKTERRESFFNLFNSKKDIEDELKDVQDPKELQVIHDSILMNEYELFDSLHSEMIPKSVLYFLNEIESQPDYDEIDEGESDEGVYSSDDEENGFVPPKNCSDKCDHPKKKHHRK